MRAALGQDYDSWNILRPIALATFGGMLAGLLAPVAVAELNHSVGSLDKIGSPPV